MVWVCHWLASKIVWVDAPPVRMTIVAALCLLVVSSASAQSSDAPAVGQFSFNAAGFPVESIESDSRLTSRLAAGPSSMLPRFPAGRPLPLPRPAVARRPSPLLPLYASYVGLQILDVDSTLRGLRAGGRESNPLVRGVIGSPALTFGLKAGATLATMYATERMWRRNRTAAVATMLAVNAVYVLVVAHNYGVAKAP